MKYLCINCSYIYDESFWDTNEWIEPWTKIEKLENCPVCFETDTFNHIDEEIIYIDEDTKDNIELEHLIELEKEWENLLVTIWSNMHPMLEEHRITWAWLYDEYWDLVAEEFLSPDSDLVVEFEDFYLWEFEVRVKCNQHNMFARKFAL